jgi:hypothetical protein
VFLSWLWTALLACAFALVVAAEWPRLSKHAAVERTRERKRPRRAGRRRKRHLEVVADDSEDFAASVARDLDSLPTIEEHERRGPN